VAVLTLIGSSFISTFVPAMPEALALLYVQKLHWIPFVVALCVALGQCLALAALYFFGEALILRIRWFDRQVGRVRERYQSHLEERFLVVAAFAGALGVPPATAVAALGYGFRIPLRHLLPLFFLCRVGRFSAIIFFGGKLTALTHGILPG
jgi:membrane protein YqaA with SNARE-associated domain